MFTPKIGEDQPILTSIFFRWVGSATNWKKHIRKVQSLSSLLSFWKAYLRELGALDESSRVKQVWMESGWAVTPG